MSPPTFLSFVLVGVYGIMFLLVSYYTFIKQSHDNLLEAFGDLAPFKRTVERWFLEFKREREKISLEDEPRSGRPPTSVTPDNIATVGRLIK